MYLYILFILIIANVNVLATQSIVEKLRIKPSALIKTRKWMDPFKELPKLAGRYGARFQMDPELVTEYNTEEYPTIPTSSITDFVPEEQLDHFTKDPNAQGSKLQIDPKALTKPKVPTEQGLTGVTYLPRRFDPSDQGLQAKPELRQSKKKHRQTTARAKVKRRSTTTKRPKKRTYLNYTTKASTTRTTTAWLTSLDPLRLMLQKKLPFFHPAPDQVGLADVEIMHPVTQGIWRFENYDDSSSKSKTIRDEFFDCEGQRIRCTHDTDYAQPVCVTDMTLPTSVPPLGRMKGFASQCEVEWRNCIRRFELKGKNYADHYSEDYLIFLHYGWCYICKYTWDYRCQDNNYGIAEDWKQQKLDYWAMFNDMLK